MIKKAFDHIAPVIFGKPDKDVIFIKYLLVFNLRTIEKKLIREAEKG